MTARILIIEDDPMLLHALVDKFKDSGYDVAGVSSGEEGLTLLKKTKYDLLLLDLLLKGINGFTTLEAIRKDPVLAPLPVIIISNSGQPVDLERARTLGIKDYLIKAEFSPEEIMAKVETVLGIKKGGGDENALLILLVEDDRFLRNIMSEKLKQSGFFVEEAPDGAEALKKLATLRPKIVLLDLLLPEVDGFGVLKSMKENPELAKIPVIVLSNLGQDEDIKRARDLGAKDYLVKAYFTPSEIVTHIEKVIKEVYF